MCIDYQFKEIDAPFLMQEQEVGREKTSALNAFLALKVSPSSSSPNTFWGNSQGGGCDREGCSVLQLLFSVPILF